MKAPHWSVPFVTVLILFIVYLAWMLVFLKAPAADIVTLMAVRGQLGDSFGVLNTLFSGLGFAAVVVTLWLQQAQIKSQERERVEEVAERRSLFNMESAITALERAQGLLQNDNNDRATWIEAARLLGHAKVLGDGVTIDCHQRVLEASKLRYRRFFSGLLEDKTAAFFYGVDHTLGTFQAAEASTAPVSGSRSISEVRHLEEASIYRIWEASQWPADFEDPVGTTFSKAERQQLMFQAVGLKEYLEFKDQYHSSCGQLRQRQTASRATE